MLNVQVTEFDRNTNLSTTTKLVMLIEQTLRFRDALTDVVVCCQVCLTIIVYPFQSLKTTEYFLKHR